MKEFVPKYKVGQEFTGRGKHPKVCTVVDIHTTYNLAGEVVKCVYVTEHDFAGQIIRDYETPEVTIARGLFKKGEN